MVIQSPLTSGALRSWGINQLSAGSEAKFITKAEVWNYCRAEFRPPIMKAGYELPMVATTSTHCKKLMCIKMFIKPLGLWNFQFNFLMDDFTQ